MKWAALLSSAGLAALSACSAGKDYIMPKLDLPASWHESAPPAPSAPQAIQAWWKSFGDDTLDSLIAKALANNQNLQAAQDRLLQARASRQTTASALYPQVQAAGQGTQANEGFQTFKQKLSLYDAEFDASYEIDLFGGNRRRVEAGDASIAASDADLRDVRLSLTAEVAREYVTWRQLQRQLQLTRDTADAQKKLYDIVQAQLNAGIVSKFDLSQADTLYKITVARIPDFERQLAASGYRLSVLLGENPGPLNEELKEMKPLPVPASLSVLDEPAVVISRRPDIQRAERQLAAETAMHGAAISEMYPKITLSALFGVQHTSLGDTALGASGAIWSLGTGVAAPLINFGKIEGQIKAAKAQQSEAFHAYRQTVLQALADVETSLSAVSKDNQKRLALAAAAESARHTFDMAQVRYKQGASDFTDVLQAQQQLYSSENDLAVAEGAAVSDIIGLYKAVGAGAADPQAQP